MTIEDTRRLGIEFERRVQTMIPETEFINKLDTETIYSYLNQYQDKYVHEIYRNLDKIESGSHLSAHVESVLQSLMSEAQLNVEKKGPAGKSDVAEDGHKDIDVNGGDIVGTGRSITFYLPEDFYMYIRSVSNVSKTFAFKAQITGDDKNAQLPIRIIPNQLVSQADVWRLIETPHDSLRILRYPAAVLNSYKSERPTLTVIYDRYTDPIGIKVAYYKQPSRFSLMTSTPCDLPLDSFDDIVTGAVDLYVQYVAGAIANKERLEKARQEAAKEAERNAAMRSRNGE